MLIGNIDINCWCLGMHSFEVSKLLDSCVVGRVILWNDMVYFLLVSFAHQDYLRLCDVPEPRLNGIADIRTCPLFCVWQKETEPCRNTFKIPLSRSDSISPAHYSLARMSQLALFNHKRAKKCSSTKYLQVGIAG